MKVSTTPASCPLLAYIDMNLIGIKAEYPADDTMPGLMHHHRFMFIAKLLNSSSQDHPPVQTEFAADQIQNTMDRQRLSDRLAIHHQAF
jgi:hypothetical protein